MFPRKSFAEKSLNRLVLVWLIFIFFISMYEISAAAEAYLKPFQKYMIELFLRK